MKKSLSLMLALVMILSVFCGFSITARATDYFNSAQVDASTLATGDRIHMGNYPQSEVINRRTLAELEKIDCKLKSYRYLKNTEQINKISFVDMSYADIVFEGKVYRKVVINEYRPISYGYSSSAENSLQDESRYYNGSTYYFEWKPIVWRVLANESDGVYLMAESALDSQPFNMFGEDTGWENCSLRKFLNNKFYNTAFSDSEKDNLVTVTLKDIPYPTAPEYCWNFNDTEDKVWIISYFDAVNEDYGFNSDFDVEDEAKTAKGTDYAFSQGLTGYGENEINSVWWLRTYGELGVMHTISKAFTNSYSYYDPETNTYEYYYSCTDGDSPVHGVRPAIKIKKDAVFNGSDSAVGDVKTYPCAHVYHKSQLAATCTKQEGFKYTCIYCNDTYNEYFETAKPLGHKWNKGTIVKYPSFVADGIMRFKCTRCTATKDEKISRYASTKITYAKSTKKKTAVVKWSKSKDADGYQFQYGLNKNFKKAKNVKTTKTNITLKNLKSKKIYYVRVRAYKKVNGKTVYSKWSAKKIKIK